MRCLFLFATGEDFEPVIDVGEIISQLEVFFLLAENARL